MRNRAPFDFSMALTIDDVLRIAHLARIDIDAPTASDAQAKLDAIFALINELQAIDTTGIEPMSHALDVVQRLRPDEAREKNQRELYQTVAPAVEEGLYLVPKVID